MIGAAINWREVLFDLRRLGLMPTNGSRELHGAVRKYIEDTTEPSHVRGELILDLWCQTTGKHRKDAPRRLHERI
ncbi:hypothetical protein [Burkholderia multivorans]|uniref:Uncharacterized protein n=1 Tax=Burkholderia multivorans TaxID=87883 RepID=A0AB37AUF2_9BURK|nr:hypothetical protein [Burkholderia multivorans]MBN6728214.1 hypothetical protein [Burkholderia multivorans]MBN6738079.1 hypothetical protein [Burkholderia multivorans]MBU9340446.1 hypothetical protein [Burkholderia multivorans]MCA8141034.1 hypothetical protein [Burkholderia multivorans]MCO1367432.1 hypothetical protein [Burkholderia multivorans]